MPNRELNAKIRLLGEANSLFTGFTAELLIGTGGLPCGLGYIFTGRSKRTHRRAALIMFRNEDILAEGGSVKSVHYCLDREVRLIQYLQGACTRLPAALATLAEPRSFTSKQACGLAYDADIVCSLQDALYANEGYPLILTAQQQVEMGASTPPMDGPSLFNPVARYFRRECVMLGLASVAEVALAAHSAGLVMTNISPPAILVTSEASWLVIGLGMAAVLTPAELLDAPPDDAGLQPFLWTAPEVVAGQTPSVLTDVFQLGLLLHALLGQRLLNGAASEPLSPQAVAELVMLSDQGQRMTAVSYQAFVDGLTIRQSNVGERLTNLCVQALSRDPRQRPDMEALLGAIVGEDEVGGELYTLHRLRQSPIGELTDEKSAFIQHLVHVVPELHPFVASTVVLNCAREFASDALLCHASTELILALLTPVNPQVWTADLFPFVVAVSVASTAPSDRTDRARSILRGGPAHGMRSGTGLVFRPPPPRDLGLATSLILSSLCDICRVEWVSNRTVITVLVPLLCSSFSSVWRCVRQSSYRALQCLLLERPAFMSRGEPSSPIQSILLGRMYQAISRPDTDDVALGDALNLLAQCMGELTQADVESVALPVFQNTDSRALNSGRLARGLFALATALSQRDPGSDTAQALLPRLLPVLMTDHVTQNEKQGFCVLVQELLGRIVARAVDIYTPQPASVDNSPRFSPFMTSPPRLPYTDPLYMGSATSPPPDEQCWWLNESMGDTDRSLEEMLIDMGFVSSESASSAD